MCRYSLTLGLVGAAFAGGMLVAVIISEMVASVGGQDYGPVKMRREVWLSRKVVAEHLMSSNE